MILLITRTKLLFASMMLLSLVCIGTNCAYAEADMNQLVDKISALETKVLQLEKRLAAKEHLIPSQNVTPISEMSSETKGLVRSLEDIRVGGYVSTSYNINSRNPMNGGTAPGTFNANGTNTGVRLYDRDANSFSENAKLSIEKPAERGGAGFRMDLLFGRIAQIFNSAITSDSPDHTAIEQMYVQYMGPLGAGLDLKAGRLGTIVGSEAIDTIDNWNISHGLIANLSQPFTHNGILGSYKFNDLLDVKLGVANGWDSSVDNNRSKTLLAGVGLHPMNGLDITNNLLLGPEQARAAGGENIEGRVRGLWDLVVGWTPIPGFDRWKVLSNFNYGWEERAPGKIGSGNAIWHGLSFATKYDLARWLSLAGRWGYFADPNGVRTAGLNGLTPTQKMMLYEMTYTLDFKLVKNLITRLEYRYDQSDKTIFDLSNGLSDGAAQSQQTFGGEMIYVF